MRDFRPAREYYPAKRASTVKVIDYLLTFVVICVIVAAFSLMFVDAVDKTQQSHELSQPDRAAVVATWTQ